MNIVANESRRTFLRTSATAAGALCLELSLPGIARAQGGVAAGASELNAWIVVHPDDTVVIRIARSEMGQGSSTGLPMLVAEELECDWAKVRTEFVDVGEHLRRNRVWVTMGTGGSRSIRDSQEFLRKAGATGREMLVTAAARRWNVPASECRAHKGVITHTASGRSVTFGKVATEAARLEPPKDVALKDPKHWTLLGTAVARIDLPDKVRGKPVFGIDVQLPGMLHASIAQCPVFGGTLARVDASGAMKMRGVKRVVELPDAVAVIADNWWRANRALGALKIEWNDGGNGLASSETIRAFVDAGLAAADVPVARNDGDAQAALASAAKTIEADYFTPFLAHATFEPQNCTALWKRDRLEVWVPTQNAEASIAAAAEAGGVSLANVELHKTQLGGGFGRRGQTQDFVRYAVRIAKAMPGVAVKTLWSREEDMQHDFYRPVQAARMKAGLDAAGRMTSWSSRLAGSSIAGRLAPERVKNGIDAAACGGFIDAAHAIPNLRVEYAMRNAHVPVGSWRSVYHSQNPFIRECFLDEVAAAAGADPYAFRRTLLATDKARRDLAILDVAAKAGDWGKPAPAGIHRGIAESDGYGSYAACVIELALQGDALDIRRVVVAVDPGYVVNVDAAKAQIEGCVIFALTAAMYGEITVRDGRVVQSNFHDYRMMRLRDTPKIEAILAPTGGFWGGMGEPPMMTIAPALVNAIHAATGRRIRSLPLANHGFRLATQA